MDRALPTPRDKPFLNVFLVADETDLSGSYERRVQCAGLDRSVYIICNTHCDCVYLIKDENVKTGYRHQGLYSLAVTHSSSYCSVLDWRYQEPHLLYDWKYEVSSLESTSTLIIGPSLSMNHGEAAGVSCARVEGIRKGSSGKSLPI